MADRIRRWFADRIIAVLCSLVCAAVAVSLAVPLLFDQETPTLRMSAGPDSTRRHAVAEYLSQQAVLHGLSIDLATNNAGCEDCLNLLRAGQLDAALVSNCVIVPNDDDIMVLGALQLEAVHVLVRSDLAASDSVAAAIRGKRVNVGEQGSTESLLAREFLAFAHLKLPSASQAGDIVPTEYSKSCLVQKCHDIQRASTAEKAALIAELPDCLLLLDSMPSTIVQLLVEVADYRIAPVPATQAFRMDNLQDSHAKKTVLEREFLERTLIPARSYFATKGFPEADCETVGVRLLVVARKSLSARAIRPLMSTLFEGEFSRRILPTSPRDFASPYAIHPGALAYLDRDKPLAIKQAMEWLNKGLSFFGAFSAGALSLYSLIRRKKSRKPSDYYAEIRNVELVAMGADADSTEPIQRQELVKYLNDRLLKLRQDLIEDICKGQIKGDHAISNILTLLTDARRNLPKLVEEAANPGNLLLRDYRPKQKAA